MSTTLYGIKNCDTIKKAKKWLDANQIPYQFHDHRVDGLDEAALTQWCQTLGWEQVLNKRGTTYRQLSDEQKHDLNESKAIALMLAQPAMIKRPILAHAGQYHLGFKAEQYQTIFSVA